MHHVRALLGVCVCQVRWGRLKCAPCEYTAECVYVRWGGRGLRCAPCESTAECVYVRWGGRGLRCAPCESTAECVYVKWGE